MKAYNDFVRTIIDRGEARPDRTGTGTLSYFGPQISFDLSLGFPLVNTKYTPFKLVAAELLWFLSGSTNNNDLKELNGNDNDTIWEEWAHPITGDLGPIYGAQWRNSGEGSVDQIANLVQNLLIHPYSRRHILTAWDPSYLPLEQRAPKQNASIGRMALAPCHVMAQFYVSMDRKLSCKMYQRSCDVFLGLPFNIASYALLTYLLAEQTGLQIGELIITFGDAHLYQNHLEQARQLLVREEFPLPKLEINPEIGSIFDYRVSDFNITEYHYHPTIKAPVAI
jgi:thymidylate synthase